MNGLVHFDICTVNLLSCFFSFVFLSVLLLLIILYVRVVDACVHCNAYEYLII